jgi:hypothetical protein
MIGWYDSCRCEQAREYYFDFLESSSRCAIPSAILTHLATCPDCQGQVHRLGDMMAGPAPSESTGTQEYRDAVMADLLQHHFAYIETPVSCSMVKPFLPSLADPDLEIRVPTPITAHLGRCMACREDVAVLRKYHLSGGQLHRISRFLGRKGMTEAPLCTEMSEVVISIGSLCFEGIRPELLTHLCVCPTCRDRVYQYRAWLQTDLEGRGPDAERPFPCEEISESDLFDYVLPYGLDLQANPYVRFRQSFCGHIRRCPQCLAKIQQLHQQIFGIADRLDSGVMTTFSLPAVPAEEVGTVVIGDSKADPPGVQVLPSQTRDRQPDPWREKTERSGRILRILKTQPAVKVVAAALLFIAMGFIYMIPAAKAVSLSGLFRTLEKTRNIHITVFTVDDPLPLQEQWLSRDLDQCLIRQRQEIVLWDWAGQKQKRIDLVSGVVHSWPIPSDLRVDMKERLDTAFGMLPFEGPASVPTSAQWGLIDSTTENGHGHDLYELLWTEREGRDIEIQRKWRVTVDSKVCLPEKAEYHIKLKTDPDYTLETTVTYEYFTRDQMQAVIAARLNFSTTSVEATP